MKILQVHTRYRQRGGEDAVVDSEAELLRSGGHEVIQHLAENPPSAVRAAGRLALAAGNPGAARAVARAAACHRPDVAHVHNTWFSLSPSVVPALRRLGVPVVLTLHNYRFVCAAATLFRDGRPCTDCVGSHPWHGVIHRCYRGSAAQSTAAALALRRAQAVWPDSVAVFVALTEFARDELVAGGLPAGKVVVKSNFVPDAPPRARPPSASPTVLYVGRLAEEKGIACLLEAWSRAGLEDWELVVVGDGPLGPALRAGAPAGVRFTGHVGAEGVRRLLLHARALVFPSLSFEGQGLSGLEAAACGLPVLASNHGALPELVDPDERHLLVPPGDVEAWARALGALREDAMVDAAGARARARYERRWTPAAALSALEAVYTRAIT